MPARPRECVARVTTTRALTPDVLEVDLAMVEPATLAFDAGQWVSVPLGPKTVRAYSIASSPRAPASITLCADVAPGGIGSAWFRGRRPGQDVRFKGPLGGFVLPPGDTRRLVLVAEEIGIVPIRAIAGELAAAGFERATTLVYWARDPGWLVYDAELRTLARRHPRFAYHPVVRAGGDLRHEQAAAHAADAYARLTRNVGVALVTAGPGVTDAVTGVANAYAARSPLLLIGGAAPLGLRGLGALQDMEQVPLLRSITKGAWSVPETRQIPEVLTTAIRVALSGRPGPVFVEIPVDLLLTTLEERLAPIPRGYVHRAPVPGDAAAIERLARLLAGAVRPVVMAGSGVYWDDAAAALAAFAEASGVPVFMNGAGRGCLPADHPLAFAQARPLALGQADVVLVLGAPLDFRLG